MVAVLFFVGQRFEQPSVVSELLDVEKVPRKPNYNMAHETPLVLWDCIFPKEGDPEGKDSLPWIYAGDDAADAKFGSRGLVDELWSVWRERKMDEVLAHQLLSHASLQGHPAPISRKKQKGSEGGHSIFEGGTRSRLGVHLPLMKRQVSHSPEEVNDHWAQKRGFRNAEEMTRNENWRVDMREAKKRKASEAEETPTGQVEHIGEAHM
jgi:tRNA pseudouridine38/39 synthase